ncbi:synaptosomal-associated protein 29-like [Asterias rubens]|uniref:synaptosomal-associated protein 29-like n=1 Tax=Asterias rubens TaxID=7604 RepID=UPI00145536B2|nr:synaptosomal-associated protein 29-like [Asterias rubens]
MSYGKRPKNPFDDDDKDFVFVPSGSSRSGGNKYGDFGYEEEENDQYGDPNAGAMSIQSQIEERQQNMLQSTQRSLGLVYESEDAGNETAHELLRQGEQLQNIDKKLDTINKDLDASKRHVTSLRSVFGGVVNYFQGKKAAKEEAAEQQRAPSKLQKMVNDRSDSSSSRMDEQEHPAMRLKNPKVTNYYSKYDTSGFEETPSSSSRDYSQKSRTQAFDSQLDDNLDELAAGLGRLKNLGLGLGDEIVRQNDDIDRITHKTGNVDTRIAGVNKDVNKILYR